MRRAVLLASAIFAEVGGSLALKGGLEHPWLFTLTVAGYALAFVFLSLLLRDGMPLGVVYGIWGATDVALTAVLAAWLFGEPLTPVMWLGIALVAAGVLCVELGSRHATAQAETALAEAALAEAATSGRRP